MIAERSESDRDSDGSVPEKLHPGVARTPLAAHPEDGEDHDQRGTVSVVIVCYDHLRRLIHQI